MTSGELTIHTLSTLERVSDAARMMPILERALAERFGFRRRIAKLAVPRVFARPGGVALIQYLLEFDSDKGADAAVVILYGEFGKAQEDDAKDSGVMKGSIFIEELQLRIHLFPYDNRLKGLGRCVKEESARDDSGALWFGWSEMVVSDSGLRFLPEKILAYRYGKRCVLGGILKNPNAADVASRQAVMKLFRPRRAAQTLAREDLLQDLAGDSVGAGFMFPKNLFADIASGIILSEAVSSPTLYELLISDKRNVDEFVHAGRRAGAALRLLHASVLPSDVPLSSYAAADELDMLNNSVTATVALAPGLASLLKSGIDELEVACKNLRAAPSALSHRDFYDKQLFVTEGTMTLIDLDTVTKADPMLDVGNFLAHLTLRKQQGLLDEHECSQSQHEFLAGYFGKDIKLEDGARRRLQWWYRTSLVRLAALYALRPQWRHLPEPLIADSRQSYERLLEQH